MDRTTVIRFLVGIAIVSALIYLNNPSKTFSMILTASPRYLALAAVFYPVMMLIYTFRWKFILSQMGEHLPMPMAFQAITGGALLSDFTPGKLGQFAKPYMISEKINFHRGLASVIIDHYADALTATILGITGLLVVPHKWNLYLILGVIVLLGGLFAISLLWLKRGPILKLVEMSKNRQLIDTAESLYDSIECIQNTPKLLAIAISIGLVIWVPNALRIFLITRSLGYTAPVYMIFFLLPLVALFSVLPVTIAGLGLTETGMALMMVMLGLPIPLGISVALLDRAISVTGDLVFGGRYVLRLLKARKRQRSEGK